MVKEVKEKEVRTRTTRTNGGVMESAPDWYDTPFEELDFEWSAEEELEIERYCEKIHKNLAESGEEMTPLERWKAHMAGKPADRKFFTVATMVVCATRTLDSYADAIKPGDLMKHPKLMVKANLATVARYKLDYPNLHITIYTEGHWGGRAKMFDASNPCLVGEPPIKSMADLEKTEVPDPYRDGLYPGYLWANRELRRIIDKYRLPMPLWTSAGPDANGTAILGMMGIGGFVVVLRKDPELAKAGADKANEWCKRIGRALIDVARPEGIYYCQFTGLFPLKGNEWVADQNAELAKDLKAVDPNVHLSHGYSFLSGISQWYEVLHEGGALTLDTFDGGTGGEIGTADPEMVMNWHQEHNLFLSYGIECETMEKGPISAIEDEVKALCERGKNHRKFAPMILPTYWTLQPHIDAAVATMKKYTKL